jgi:hypothetical protein
MPYAASLFGEHCNVKPEPGEIVAWKGRNHRHIKFGYSAAGLTRTEFLSSM